MKHERKKGFISGILVTVMLFALIGSAKATVGTITANLEYSNIKITLNGETLTPTDVNGNAVEPFIIDGTTYLPVRAISNALGLDVDWDGTTKTVILEGSTAGETIPSYSLCYPDFSVPALDNVVGSDAFVYLYPLDIGDSIAYCYDPAKIKTTDYLTEYGSLLAIYGFSSAETIEGAEAHYENEISGTAVLIDTDASGYILVLVINSDKAQSSGTSSSLPSSGSGSASSINKIDFTFPLHLYSNDGKVYLGKLVTNKYDTDSIWNQYGTYGSKYSTNSIWNEYGTYGSKFSIESAFNGFATKPPMIVDDNGKFFGYLTANEYIQDGYTITELQRYLLQNNQ